MTYKNFFSFQSFKLKPELSLSLAVRVRLHMFALIKSEETKKNQTRFHTNKAISTHPSKFIFLVVGGDKSSSRVFFPIFYLSEIFIIASARQQIWRMTLQIFVKMTHSSKYCHIWRNGSFSHKFGGSSSKSKFAYYAYK